MQTNCENCGGVLTLSHFQDQVSCSYCETVHVPSLCEDSQIEKLSGVFSEWRCPLCTKSLSHARIGSCIFQYCNGCRGLLLEGDDLLELIRYSRSNSRKTDRRPDPIKPEDLARRIECPSCKDVMSAHPYYGPGDFVIDACPGCKRVWLDGGELARSSTVVWGGSIWN